MRISYILMILQFGLLDVNDVSNMEPADDDEDLEAELLALTSGGKKKPKKKGKFLFIISKTF